MTHLPLIRLLSLTPSPPPVLLHPLPAAPMALGRAQPSAISDQRLDLHADAPWLRPCPFVVPAPTPHPASSSLCQSAPPPCSRFSLCPAVLQADRGHLPVPASPCREARGAAFPVAVHSRQMPAAVTVASHLVGVRGFSRPTPMSHGPAPAQQRQPPVVHHSRAARSIRVVARAAERLHPHPLGLPAAMCPGHVGMYLHDADQSKERERNGMETTLLAPPFSN